MNWGFFMACSLVTKKFYRVYQQIKWVPTGLRNTKFKFFSCIYNH